MRNLIVIAISLFLMGFNSTVCCSVAHAETCCSVAHAEKNTGAQSIGAREVAFIKPQNKEALDYLGLEGNSKTFTISQIKADVLVVEVFSWDCHFCQRQAPRMAKLYDLLASKGYSDRIKIIGFGATNTDLEILEYQKMFKILFPLIVDTDYKSYGVVGRLEIPSVSVFMRDDQGVLRLVSSKSREQRSAENMLKDILSATGL